MKNNPEAVMRWGQHFAEARKRLLLSLLGIGLGSIVGWFLYQPVMGFITQPITQLNAERISLNFQTIGAAFDLKLRVSLWVGVVLSSPWWVAQIGAFIAPALKRREKIFVCIFSFFGVLLFALGATSGVLVAPHAVEILSSFTPSDAWTLLRADAYVTFFTRLVILFGISFLLPEVLVLANFVGLLSAKRMLKAWRIAVIGAFVFTAIANPLPSPWPMIIQALVLLVFYFLAIGISALHDWRRHRRLEQ